MFIEKVLYNQMCKTHYIAIQREFIRLFDVVTSESFLIDLLKAAIDNFAELAFNLKSIYCHVADERKITRLSIERNLTTLLDHWEEREKFKDLFETRPTNAVALHIIARKIRYLNCSVYDTLLMP